MEKVSKKNRTITFHSNKNNQVMTVHTREARIYAKVLENDQEVQSYETNIQWSRERYMFVNKIRIRKMHFESDWSSDFKVYYKNGTIAIREVLSETALNKDATIEKLELSRRYWHHAEHITNWKIILI